MPCRSYGENGETIMSLGGGGGGEEQGNTDEETWSEDETYQTGTYMQLAEHTGDTGVFSSDEDEDDTDHSTPDHSTPDHSTPEPPLTIDLDRRIEQALGLPDLDNVVQGSVGPGFPDPPPLDIDPRPSPGQQAERQFDLSADDADFIRSSMSGLSITAPPWADSVTEGNWKEELRKHLSKD